VPLDDLGGGLVDLHAAGLRLVGADESAPLAYRDSDLRGPLALVVGSEGRGIAGHVRRRLDLVVRIPMHGRVASLNAAVAGSVLLFEAAAQRPTPTRPSPATRAAKGAPVEAPEAPEPDAEPPPEALEPDVEPEPAPDAPQEVEAPRGAAASQGDEPPPSEDLLPDESS
jgi:hypothetical protein